MERTLDETKASLIANINKRVTDKVIEKQNGDTLIRFINTAQTIDDANFIYTVGTKYKSTGFHFDFRKDKIDNDTIYYFQKNQKLSFQPTNKNGLTHKLIIGDNYKALLNLLIEYRGKIDVIYIDPPYGKDDMGDFAKTNYENNISRDNLLSMLQTRLLLAKDLLSDTGTIFCSIDDKNQAYVKCLFDNVFGEENFVTCIPRITKKQRAAQEKHLDVSHDYILCYSYANDFLHVIDREIDEEKTFTDSIGTYIQGDTKAILAAVSQGYSVGGDYDFEYNGKIYKPITKNGTRNRWLWTKERMQAAANLGILVESGNTLREQLYIDKKFDETSNTMEPKDTKLIFHTSDFMTDNCFSNSTGKANLKALGEDLGNSFDNPKPVELIKYLLRMCSFKENINVLDFFAGSGTTGQAVIELNKEDSEQRKFILVQYPEVLKTESKNTTIKNAIVFTQNHNLEPNIASTTAARLKRVMTGSCYDGSADFKWLENNTPYGDGLDVYNIASVSAMANQPGQTPFDVIDETLYGKEKLNTNDKIDWVCSKFEMTNKKVESDKDWEARVRGQKDVK